MTILLKLSLHYACDFLLTKLKDAYQRQKQLTNAF